jgi:hypothetical protein
MPAAGDFASANSASEVMVTIVQTCNLTYSGGDFRHGFQPPPSIEQATEAFDVRGLVIPSANVMI